MTDTQRAGYLIGIVRLEKTRHPDLDPVTFATIDGDRYHQVQNDAALGDELELWKEGSNTRPMAADLRWVLQQAAGYMTGSMEGVTREGAAEPAVQRVAREAREKEAAFEEEHGMSSAEYFHESGYSDADDERAFLERAAEEAAQEDEDEYGEAQAELEGEL